MKHGDKAKAKAAKASRKASDKKSSKASGVGKKTHAVKATKAGSAKASAVKSSPPSAQKSAGNAAPSSLKPPVSQTQPSPQPSSGLSRSIPTPSAASQIDGGIRYLSVQDLVDLHKAVSTEFGGNQAHPGVVESQFGLLNAVQRPQVTTLGREAYPQFADKVAAFVFALLQARPFQGGNRRVALASIVAFCEVNNRSIDSRVLDEKTQRTFSSALRPIASSAFRRRTSSAICAKSCDGRSAIPNCVRGALA